MGCNIQRNPENAYKILSLLKEGTVGDVQIMFGSDSTRSKWCGFMFIKTTIKMIKVYQISNWPHQNQFKRHIAEIRPGNKLEGLMLLKWLCPIKDERGPHWRSVPAKNGIGDWTYRAFLSLGMIKNVGIRFVRISELWKFNDQEVASIRSKNLLIDFNGNLLSQVPSECRKLHKEALETNRIANNRNARANYANYVTVRKVNKAKETGYFDDLHPSDIFKVRNVTTRTWLIEHFGQDRILETLDPNVIDKDVIDGSRYELLRFDIPDNSWGQNRTREATYLKMINPSTGEHCIEGVPNDANGSMWSNQISMNTVRQALRWRDGDESTYVVPKVLT